jgi:hypothetical protein
VLWAGLGGVCLEARWAARQLVSPQAVKSDAFFGPAGRPRWVLGLSAAIQRGATDRQGRAQDMIKNFVLSFLHAPKALPGAWSHNPIQV